jgi:hypothetical protein
LQEASFCGGQLGHVVFKRLVRRAVIDNVEAESLAALIAAEVGKPIRFGRSELQHCLDMLDAIARRAKHADETIATNPAWFARRRPHGVVAAITPWNNPLYIPLGKIVPAVVFGNAVARAIHPERFMAGCADPGQGIPDLLRNYLEAFGCPILPMRFESAELCKIAINCFLVSSVTTSNTLAEMYTMLRYLGPEMLSERKVDHFDAWAANFAEPSVAGWAMKWRRKSSSCSTIARSIG